MIPMNGVEEQSVRDFVQYTSNEITKAKASAVAQDQQLTSSFEKGYQEYKNKKNQLTDEQLKNFKGYSEISSAFDFQAPFEERIGEELDALVKQFETKKLKSKEEIEKEQKKKQQIERENKLIQKANTIKANTLADNEQNEEGNSGLQTDQLRESFMSEVELDIRQIGKKRALNEHDLETYK